MSRTALVTVGLASLLGLAGCDTTYTPGMHHQDSASTGSMLSGTDTGANADSGRDPSITTGVGNVGGGH